MGAAPKGGSGPFGRMHDLYYQVGKALMRWQEVEETHFKLFFRLLGADNHEIAAAVYFSIESFEARHRIVGRMAPLYLTGRTRKKQRTAWEGAKGGLNKRIKDANDERNKLAHYNAEIINQSQIVKDRSQKTRLKVRLSGPRLRPSAYNIVNRLMGKGPDNPAHDLDIETIEKLSESFRALAVDINEFEHRLPRPPAPSLAQSLGLPPWYLLKRRQSQTSTSHPKDGEPSE